MVKERAHHAGLYHPTTALCYQKESSCLTDVASLGFQFGIEVYKSFSFLLESFSILLHASWVSRSLQKDQTETQTGVIYQFIPDFFILFWEMVDHTQSKLVTHC